MARILIVEDEKKIARFLELELKHEGYEVLTAFDGRSGLDTALNEDPDLLKEQMRVLVALKDENEIIAQMQKMIPTYTPNHFKV